ncbi:hypothetical protein DRE_03494 [Drechslerella stenobrocha 248]|uniref:UBX domain-containing protein n=1 Tax=Drechslerella stenobrocha 248 TaxID=1043628 RepID=W7IDQ7_9PEZI|nr:hypothetical protein DRE_03494 [Drechslerella stenobrocha 248]
MSNPTDGLTEAQQTALTQYTAVTNQDAPSAINLLRRCQWNVEIAITRFFDGEPTVDPVVEAQAQEAAQRAAQREVLQQTLRPPNARIPSSSTSPTRSNEIIPAPRIVPQPTVPARRAPGILALFFLPLSVAWKVTQGVAYLFSTLFPFLPRLLSGFYSPLNRARRSGGSGGAGGSGGGSAGTRRALNPRDTAGRFAREFEEEHGATGLPWFEEGGYAQALDVAKRELRFLLVVLVSPEHDDTAGYARETLGSAEFVRFVKERQIVLWGGNVADSEAYQVSTALQCTKFPFAALITHTPQASATAMSVVARVVGVVSPQAMISKLTATIAAHSDALTAVRTRRAAEAADRNIRDEQDRAYEVSRARDAERAIQPGAGAAGTARIALTMGDGVRVVRRFAAEDAVEEVYAFVECAAVLEGGDYGEAEDEEGLLDGYKHEYGFRLVANLPRRVYEVGEGTVGDCFGRSVALIVEPAGDDDAEDDDEEE